MNKKNTLIFEMAEGDPTVRVSHKQENLETSYSISEQAFSQLFAGQYSTGFFSIVGDGPVYIESRQGHKLIIVQRAARKDVEITVRQDNAEEKHTVDTPWTMMIFLLKAKGGNLFEIVKHHLVLTEGSHLGETTKIFSPEEMLMNTYNWTHGGSNICWGSTIVMSPTVTQNSLVGLLNEFYTQAFTMHLLRSITPWQTYTTTGKLTADPIGQIDKLITDTWNTLGA